jgi:hypothetical protein
MPIIAMLAMGDDRMARRTAPPLADDKQLTAGASSAAS